MFKPSSHPLGFIGIAAALTLVEPVEVRAQEAPLGHDALRRAVLPNSVNSPTDRKRDKKEILELTREQLETLKKAPFCDYRGKTVNNPFQDESASVLVAFLRDSQIDTQNMKDLRNLLRGLRGRNREMHAKVVFAIDAAELNAIDPMVKRLAREFQAQFSLIIPNKFLPGSAHTPQLVYYNGAKASSEIGSFVRKLSRQDGFPDQLFAGFGNVERGVLETWMVSPEGQQWLSTPEGQRWATEVDPQLRNSDHRLGVSSVFELIQNAQYNPEDPELDIINNIVDDTLSHIFDRDDAKEQIEASMDFLLPQTESLRDLVPAIVASAEIPNLLRSLKNSLPSEEFADFVKASGLVSRAISLAQISVDGDPAIAANAIRIFSEINDFASSTERQAFALTLIYHQEIPQIYGDTGLRVREIPPEDPLTGKTSYELYFLYSNTP